MNWLQFISEMIGHLAWPIVVLIVVFAVRKHLGALADRILELSFGGASVKFGKLLSKGAEIIEGSATLRLPSPASSQAELPLSLPKRNINAAIRETRLPPDAWSAAASRAVGVNSVFDGYRRIELALDDMGEVLGVKARNGTLMEMLLRRDLITPSLLELYQTLRLARNSMAHGTADLPNEAEAQEYMMQAGVLAGLLSVTAAKIRELKKRSLD
jgi:hypothetical protein